MILVTKRVKEVTEYFDLKCDICGRVDGPSNHDDYTLKVLYDTNYDGDGGYSYELDVCEDCMKDKVNPVIKDQLGVSFRKIDMDRSSYSRRLEDGNAKLEE